MLLSQKKSLTLSNFNIKCRTNYKYCSTMYNLKVLMYCLPTVDFSKKELSSSCSAESLGSRPGLTSSASACSSSEFPSSAVGSSGIGSGHRGGFEGEVMGLRLGELLCGWCSGAFRELTRDTEGPRPDKTRYDHQINPFHITICS